MGARSKKAMKTTNHFDEASAPANVQPSSVLKNRDTEPRRLCTELEASRELPTVKGLDYLKAQLPQPHELAEIVGKWIWIDFPKATHRAAANTPLAFGFPLESKPLRVAAPMWRICSRYIALRRTPRQIWQRCRNPIQTRLNGTRARNCQR